LQADALAYINLDTAISGDNFHAAGSPVFRKLLLQVLKRVGDPHANATLRDLWDRRGGELEGLGAGSDYVAFQDMAGTSSIDLHFDGPPFPYHSSYDNFGWMERVGDPDFVYHNLLTQVLGLLLIELADRPVMPFDMTAYAVSIRKWVAELASWAVSRNTPLDLDVLKSAANTLGEAVVEFEKWEVTWENKVLASSDWEPLGLGRQREEYNTRMGRFESDLLDLEIGGGVSICYDAGGPGYFWFLLLTVTTDSQPHPVQTRRFWAPTLVRLRRGVFPRHPRHHRVGRLGAGEPDHREGGAHHAQRSREASRIVALL